jgi:hypothetical protein
MKKDGENLIETSVNDWYKPQPCNLVEELILVFK